MNGLFEELRFLLIDQLGVSGLCCSPQSVVEYKLAISTLVCPCCFPLCWGLGDNFMFEITRL